MTSQCSGCLSLENSCIRRIKDERGCDARDVREVWATGERLFYEIFSSYRRIFFTVKLELRTTFLFDCKNYRDFRRFFSPPKKASNAGCFGKKCGNAGKYQICWIPRTIAGWLTPMQAAHLPNATTVLLSPRYTWVVQWRIQVFFLVARNPPGHDFVNQWFDTVILAPTITSHLHLRRSETPLETNSGYATGGRPT